MLVTLCQLLVVLFSLFRVVWDFLVGCLGFFTEGSCSLFYPLIAWVCATRCFSLFTCQRFKGRCGLLHTFHRGGSWLAERLKAEKGQVGGNSMWVSYHVVSLVDSLVKVRACLLCSLRTLPQSVLVNNNCRNKNLTRATGEEKQISWSRDKDLPPLAVLPEHLVQPLVLKDPGLPSDTWGAICLSTLIKQSTEVEVPSLKRRAGSKYLWLKHCQCFVYLTLNTWHMQVFYK